MKIEKFVKLGSSKYKVFFDNKKSMTIYDDVILKYNLLTNNQIDEKTLIEINKANEIAGIKDTVIKYIGLRIRSTKEIDIYLEKKGIAKKEREKLIDFLSEKKLIDDELFAVCFAKDKFSFNNVGPLKIAKELEKHCIDPHLINKAVLSIDEGELKNKVNKIIDKLIKVNHKYTSLILKQKIINHLCNMGYQKELVYEMLESKTIDNGSNMINKEYEKLRRKFSRKYSDDELRFKICQSLYKKGFTKEEIENTQEY